MWVLAKYKSSEFNLMRENLKKEFGDNINVYRPLLKIKSFYKNKITAKQKTLLGDYIFISHEKFKDNFFLNKINYIRGIKFCFKNSIYTQKDILNFIEKCKQNTTEGFVSQSFFEIIQKKNIFISGPFSNLIFEILEERKNSLKVMIGNFKTNIKKNAEYLFKPI